MKNNENKELIMALDELEKERGINKKYLSREEIKTLNAYHKRVYHEVSPFLTAKEKAWLASQTKAL